MFGTIFRSFHIDRSRRDGFHGKVVTAAPFCFGCEHHNAVGHDVALTGRNMEPPARRWGRQQEDEW